MEIKKILFFLFISLFMISLVGCNKEKEKEPENNGGETVDPEPDKDIDQLETVGISPKSTLTFYNFDPSKIILELNYSKSGKQEMTLNSGMIKTDLNNLVVGENTIEIECFGKKTSVKITILEDFDKIINDILNENDAIIYLKEENNTYTVSLITNLPNISIEFTVKNQDNNLVIEKISENIVGDIEEKAGIFYCFYINLENQAKTTELFKVFGTNLTENMLEFIEGYFLIGSDMIPIEKNNVKILIK